MVIYCFFTLLFNSASSIPVILDSSFSEEVFYETDKWDVAGQSTNNYFIQCSQINIFGGQNSFGTGAKIEKQFSNIPPHKQIKINMTFYKQFYSIQIIIYTWDQGEDFQIFIDNIKVNYITINDSRASCELQQARKQFIELYAEHINNNSIVKMTSSLNQQSQDESWGIRDFFIYYDECSIIPKHYFYNFIFSGIDSICQISECNGVQLVGGFNISGQNAIAERIFNLGTHKRIKLQLTLYIIGSWDNEYMTIKVDDKIVWSQQYSYNDGKNLCGSNLWIAQIKNIELVIAHTNKQLKIQFSSNLNESPNNGNLHQYFVLESWGFSDFKLFIDPQDQCVQIYDQLNYGGNKTELCSLESSRIENRDSSQIRSLKLNNSEHISLYDDQGDKITFDQDQSDITQQIFSTYEVDEDWIEIIN